MKKKYVKKADMWCITWFDEKGQHQQWFHTEEEADGFIKGKRE